MFCPGCAAKNQEQTKFCRGCGRNLEAVALAVNGQNTIFASVSNAREKILELTHQWLKSQSDGIQGIVQGFFVIGIGVLLGVPLALFSTNTDWHSNWILIWLFLCGWIPVLGAIRMGTGFSKLIQSRMIRRSMEKLTAAMTEVASLPAEETTQLSHTAATEDVPALLSVSEDTTAPLPTRHPRL